MLCFSIRVADGASLLFVVVKALQDANKPLLIDSPSIAKQRTELFDRLSHVVARVDPALKPAAKDKQGLVFVFLLINEEVEDVKNSIDPMRFIVPEEMASRREVLETRKRSLHATYRVSNRYRETGCRGRSRVAMLRVRCA